MKVITLHQPWATLAVLGIKKIETRSWKTNYRGPILIHAAQAHNDIGRALFEGQRVKGYATAQNITLPNFYHQLPFGCIIGQVEIFGCVNTEVITFGNNIAKHFKEVKALQELVESVTNYYDREALLGDLSPARYGWYLHKAQKFEFPIIAKGQQRFWNYDLPIKTEIHA